MIRCKKSEIARCAVASPGTAPTWSNSSGLLLPANLSGHGFQKLLADLVGELYPIGVVENALVRQLASHESAAELWGTAGMALARQAAQMLPGVMPIAIDGGKAEDQLLAAAMSPQVVRDAERNTHGRCRSYLRTLRVLLDLQATRRMAAARDWAALPPGFADEDECQAYLAAWWQDRDWICPVCRHDSGYCLPARKAWECSGCHRQCGLRSGTVMAESALPLRSWVEAIRQLLWEPRIRAPQLAERLGLPRLATVRSMIERIREALASEDSSERLAGLDDYFARAAAHLSQVRGDSASAAAAENRRGGVVMP